MYKTKDLDAQQLADIEIANQEEIRQAYDFPLDLKLAWNEIKRRSDNFQIEDENLLEIDQLLADLLEKKGIDLAFKSEKELELIRIREKERLRQIELLKIKLKLNIN